MTTLIKAGMFKKFLPVLFCLLLSGIVSRSQGLVFVNGLSWEQVKQKAKAENKFIFVDCFASWCIPCYEMDKTVFSSTAVGEALSPQFISVKIQMDSTAGHLVQDKEWRKVALKLEEEYRVSSYPTYLFFSPEGQLVHRLIGAMPADKFVQQAKQSTDPAGQYYTLVRTIAEGQMMDDSVYTMLNGSSLSFRDTAGRRIIARGYISKLERDAENGKAYNVKAIKQVASFISSDDKHLFALVCREAATAGPVFDNTDYCELIVMNIIEREEIMSKLVAGENYKLPLVKKPEWKKLYKIIARKYNEQYAEKAILIAKRKWYYESKQDWNEWTKSSLSYFEKYVDLSPGNSQEKKRRRTAVNNLLFNQVFMHVSDKNLLKRAAIIQRAVVDAKPDDAVFIDTYANLLYRAGERDKAIEWQEIAVKKDPLNKGNASNLDKMKQGQPTWNKPGL